MKKLLITLAGLLLTAGVVSAQVSTNYWKLQAGVLSPANSSWTVNAGSGSATNTYGFIIATTTLATSTFAGDVYITGNLKVTGNFFAPVAISSASDIKPSADITYSLGSGVLRWLNVYTKNITATSYTGVALVPATTTSMTVDWTAGSQQTIRLSTSATAVVFSNATSTASTTLSLMLWACNPPTGTAGAITFSDVYWIEQTTPTQTTTANNCTVYSFKTGFGTSTSNLIIIGAGSGKI